MYVFNEGEIIFDESVIQQLNFESKLDTLQSTNTVPEEIISNIVCKTLKIDYQLLCSPSGKRCISHQRILLIDLWITYANLNIVEIAKRLHRTHGTLLRQLTRFQLEKNQYFSPKTLEKIHDEINALLQ